jgi:hypothetical protein
MKRGQSSAAARVLEALSRDAEGRLLARDGVYELQGTSNVRMAAADVRQLLSRGLLTEAEPGRLAASEAAAAWLKRRASDALPFRMQHGAVEQSRLADGSAAEVLVDIAESPIGVLARSTRGGAPWLQPHAVGAAERLRRDFEIGRLQPRITANWSASVATRRRSGDAAGLGHLTEMAVAARRRFDRAMLAVGPERSGVLVDVCCFLKGLEIVERERQWPARSAKLVLRLALDSLARHYGYSPAATGVRGSAATRHWGAEDYRPKVS